MRRIPDQPPPDSPPVWQLESRPEPAVAETPAERSIFGEILSRTPVTIGIIVLNVLVYLVFNMDLAGLEIDFFRHFALIPAALTGTSAISQMGGSLTTLFSHMFLHGSSLHIFVNMFVLFQFGAFVEMRIGSRSYLAFYLIAGLAAALIQIAITPASAVPAVGASGAIAGVLGGFIFLYPRSKLLFFFLVPMSADRLGQVFVYLMLFLIASPLFLGGVELFGSFAHGAHMGGYTFGYLSFFLAGKLIPEVREPLSPEDAFRDY